MRVEMSEIHRGENANSSTISCSGVSAWVSVYRSGGVLSGRVVVVVENASHRAWRGSGKSFDSMVDAKKHYKSTKMKAILDAASSELSQ